MGRGRQHQRRPARSYAFGLLFALELFRSCNRHGCLVGIQAVPIDQDTLTIFLINPVLDFDSNLHRITRIRSRAFHVPIVGVSAVEFGNSRGHFRWVLSPSAGVIFRGKSVV